MMANLIFVCSVTDLSVKHQTDDDPKIISDAKYEVIICPACTRLHFINRRTGKPFANKE
jgi:hypothetical protein